MEAEPLQWWLKGCRGHRMEAQWPPQWSLNGRYWSAKGSTMVGQGRHRSHSYTICTTVCILLRGDQWPTSVHPFCDLSAIHVPSCCLLWTTRERPTSSVTFVRLFWTCSKLHDNHGVHGEVWMSSVRPLNNKGNLSTSFVPSKATWPVFNLVEQRRHKGRIPCEKWV